jgi:hypothetical protein
MRTSNLKTVTYALQLIAKGLPEALHWKIIETYWNTAMQQNNIWSIPCEERRKEILKVVS